MSGHNGMDLCSFNYVDTDKLVQFLYADKIRTLSACANCIMN